MPTGYTADVATGKVDDFETFAWTCARAFGALVALRDDPLDGERPELFQPSDYNLNGKKAAETRLDELRRMKWPDVIASRAAAQKAAETAREKAVENRNEQRARYETMLEKARAWEPPTASHDEMKRFMIEQLQESIRLDCGTEYLADCYPDQPPAEDWLENEIQKTLDSISYHAKEHALEVARVKERNAWVAALADSLAP